MRGISIDPDSDVVGEHYAVIYAPRRQRGRFPETCVEVVDAAEDALEKANPDNKTYPAKVIGPSKSSEGVRMFYLDHWLDDE